MVDLATQIWRDFNTDGVPASGKHKPLKSKIREWGADVENKNNANASRFATRGAIKALNTAAIQFAYLGEAGREGYFAWSAANYSAEVTADTSEGLYLKSDGAAASAGAWVRMFTGPVNVRWFGAKGDYVPGTGAGTNDQAAFAGAIAMTRLTGGKIFVPRGDYKIASPLVIDTTALTGFVENGRVSIEGEGSGCARLHFTGSSGQTLLKFQNADFGSGGQWLRGRLAGLHLLGVDPAPATGTIGLDIDHAIFFEMYDVEISQFHYGMKARDVVAMALHFVRFTYNNYGELHEDTWTDSAVNEVAYSGCHWLNNRQYGLWAKTGGNLTFTGGSFENNGAAGAWSSDGSRWGLRIKNGGQFSVVPLCLQGVHFEGQANIADIWIEHDDWPASYKISGCDFFRVGTTNYVTNDILIDTTGDTACDVVLLGCGFHGVNGYTANAARRRVAFGTVTGTLHRLTAIGCRGLESGLTDGPTMTGTAGAALPDFTAQANSFTALQTFIAAATGVAALAAQLSDNGASAGPYITGKRISSSPAVSDLLNAFGFEGSNSSAAQVLYADIVGVILDATAGSEDGFIRLRSLINAVMTTGLTVGDGVSVGTAALPGAGKVNVPTEYQVNATRVVNSRKTGWGVPTGTLTRSTYVTSTVTLPQLAERVAALIADLEATSGHGLIGA